MGTSVPWELACGVLGVLFFVLLNRMKSFVVLLTFLVGCLGFFLTYIFVPVIAKLIVSDTKKPNNLYGYDLGKGRMGGEKKIPESLGIVPGIMYICSVCLIIGILNEACKRKEFVIRMLQKLHRKFEFKDFNLKRHLPNLLAGLFSSMFMLFLGFCDDVLELRWRYKLILPSLAVIPMLVTYNGSTIVLLPRILGGRINVGSFYLVYMGLVAVFCSNAINILAGINGLEVLQSIVIAFFVILHNAIELKGPNRKNHLFSLILMVPFIFVVAGMLVWNWYPSTVFIGDSFTYFSGMTLATVGVLGHFSKTLMLLFIPQWINFLYSVPQLFGIIPISRHRVPIFVENDGLLHDSKNHTLINLFLKVFGPMREDHLTLAICLFQVIMCSLGLLIRHFFMKKTT